MVINLSYEYHQNIEYSVCTFSLPLIVILSLSPCFQIGRNEEDAHICRVFCEELEIPFYRFSPTVEEVVGTAETNNLKICEAIIRYIKDK